MRDHTRKEWEAGGSAVSPSNREYVTPDQMRTAAAGLAALADEWDQRPTKTPGEHVTTAPDYEPTRRERQDRIEMERGIRSTVTRIAECIRHLDAQDAAVYMREFHPHSDRFLAEGMRPDPARIGRAIEFLAALQKEISQ